MRDEVSICKKRIYSGSAYEIRYLSSVALQRFFCTWRDTVPNAVDLWILFAKFITVCLTPQMVIA